MKLAVAEKVYLSQFPVDKYNVAWFKLAEFVGRREKERALSVYRLLSHSLSDEAFAAQLEGDLFMAFHDEKALDAYQRAAKLYEKKGQFTHAALLYEQMIMLQPENKEYILQALKLYETIKNDVKIARCAGQLARVLIKSGALDKLNELMGQLHCSLEYQLYVQEMLVVSLIEFYPDKSELIQDYLIIILRAFESKQDYQMRLSLFFAKLSALNTQWYETACKLIKKL